MTQLEQVLQELDNLNLDELRKVEERAQHLLSAKAAESQRDRDIRFLEESGLVRNVNRQPLQPYARHELISVDGEPISETIVKERR